MNDRWFIVSSPPFTNGGYFDPPESACDLALVAAGTRKEAMWKALGLWRKLAKHGHVWWSGGVHPLRGVKAELVTGTVDEEFKQAWKPWLIEADHKDTTEPHE